MRAQRSTASRAGLAGVAALCAGALVACSTSSGGSGSPGAAPSAAAGLTQAQISTLLSYTGGTAGVATGTPVTFGYINSQGGTTSIPDYTTGMDAAVKLLNTELGGLGGHPVKLVSCFVASTDEEGQSCAQKFLADPSLVGVLQGAVEVGAASFHSTIGGTVPVLGVNPTDISDAIAKNAYYIEGGQFSAPSIVTYLTTIAKAKKVAILGPSGIPAVTQAVSVLTADMKKAGITVTQASFSPSATDYLAPLQASGAANADVVVPLTIAPQQCTAFSNAMNQLAIDTKVVTLSACLGPALKAALKDYPKWTYLDFTVNPDATDADATVNAQVAAYKAWLAPFASKMTVPGVGVQTLQMVLTLAKMVGTSTTPLTRTSLAAAIKAYKGQVFLGAPSIAYGSNPVLTAIGVRSARFYSYLGDGAWQDETGGKWLEPPAD